MYIEKVLNSLLHILASTFICLPLLVIVLFELTGSYTESILKSRDTFHLCDKIRLFSNGTQRNEGKRHRISYISSI